ncbi:hypothetical protein J5N97_022976 [Dioscorea zingiberensis]|uniref:Uncharacterized protein n=1 Tax=Dioscorea zingiberensis TaxID=325984 RepID=A0A9D5HB50_9LILI|nr:hypothetical protein J5N97_022976 [Dioscorea zingiberensis]
MLMKPLHSLRSVKTIEGVITASTNSEAAEEFMLLKRDDGVTPIGTILAPLEAELKLARQEIGNLQDDNRALDCLTKSKDVALLDAEGTVQIALAKASMVDDLQSKNQEL